MEEELKQIIAAVEEEIRGIRTAADFEQYKARISGPNGSFTAMSKKIGSLPGAGDRLQPIYRRSEQSRNRAGPQSPFGIGHPRRSCLQGASREGARRPGQRLGHGG